MQPQFLQPQYYFVNNAFKTPNPPMRLTQIIQLGWHMLGRDRRAGELRLLLLALIIAVTAMTSVGFFVDRLRAGLERDAAQLLGGDLVLNSDTPMTDAVRDAARGNGLSIAETVNFASMALAVQAAPAHAEVAADPAAAPANFKSQLSAIKAVSPGYPLRGKLRVATAPAAPDAIADGEPAPGTVWVDGALLPALGVQMGDAIQLGDQRFTIARVITLEPDRDLSFINIAPRIMLPLADLPATGLIQNGSRVSYRMMFAGSAEAIRDFRAAIAPQLLRGQRFESLESGQPRVRSTLDRAEQFLSLVAMLTAMLAAVAVALAARRYTQRHLDGCAVMRCLGISQGGLLGLYLVEFVLIGVIGAALGVVLGYAAHFVFIELLGSIAGLQAASLPQPTLLPALQGFLLGFVLLIGFALPPIVQLRHVPPIRVLRREVGLPRSSTALGYVFGIGLFAALLIWAAGNLKIGLLTAGGFAVAFALFALVTWLLIRLLGTLRHRVRLNPAWRFALASIERRPVAVIVQTVALAVGLMALLLLSVTRTDLVAGWKKAAPPDAPNRFVINIQPDQRTAFKDQLHQAGLNQYDFYPMVRGRLISVNGNPVGTGEDEEARDAGDGKNDKRNGAGKANNTERRVNREYNLSYTDTLPEANRVTAGTWFAPNATDEVSMEEGVAQRLRIKLGDALTFDVGGQEAKGRVTSLRKLDWDSMHVNFFVIFPPAVLEPMAQTSIAAFRLEPAQANFGNQLVAQFPNITLVDTGAVLEQVQNILEQVVTAIEFLFVFTLVAGVLVLYAALLSSRDERTREAALLRALGASRSQLSNAQLAEFVSIGVLAGVLAAAGAVAVGYLLSTQAFDFPYHFDFLPWVWGVAGGAAIALIGGWLGLRPVLNQPPLASLRDV